jgi:hypothetical protein
MSDELKTPHERRLIDCARRVVALEEQLEDNSTPELKQLHRIYKMLLRQYVLNVDRQGTEERLAKEAEKINKSGMVLPE